MFKLRYLLDPQPLGSFTKINHVFKTCNCLEAIAAMPMIAVKIPPEVLSAETLRGSKAWNVSSISFESNTGSIECESSSCCADEDDDSGTASAVGRESKFGTSEFSIQVSAAERMSSRYVVLQFLAGCFSRIGKHGFFYQLKMSRWICKVKKPIAISQQLCAFPTRVIQYGTAAWVARCPVVLNQTNFPYFLKLFDLEVPFGERISSLARLINCCVLSLFSRYAPFLGA